MSWMRLGSVPHSEAAKVDQLADRHLERRRQLRHEADLAEYHGAVGARVEAV